MIQEPINILMLTYNRINYFKAFIKYLYLFTNYPFRLIVVDNGSTDGTRELILRLYQNGFIWKHLFNKENLPMAAAFTEGFKLVESELFVTAPDDIIPPAFKDPCWLTLLVAKMKTNEEVGSINLKATRGLYRSFQKRYELQITERIKAEGGKRLALFNRLEKVL